MNLKSKLLLFLKKRPEGEMYKIKFYLLILILVVKLIISFTLHMLISLVIIKYKNLHISPRAIISWHKPKKILLDIHTHKRIKFKLKLILSHHLLPSIK
jgi:hypothetical protein